MPMPAEWSPTQRSTHRQLFNYHSQLLKHRVYCGCGKPALYSVGKKLFCEDHRDQAYEAARKEAGRAR